MNTTQLTAATVRTATAAIFEMEMEYTSNKVFVADLYNVCGAMLGLYSGTLDEFKTELVRLYRAGEVVLSKLDMPQVVAADRSWRFVERCQVQVGETELGLVRI